MKSSGFIRHLMLGTLVFTVLFAVAAPIASAQHSAGEMKTLEEMKRFLRDEGRARDLSQLTHEELANISPSPGGMLGNLASTEYVFKIGTSTFIVNMLAIFLIILIAGTVVILMLIIIIFNLSEAVTYAALSISFGLILLYILGGPYLIIEDERAKVTKSQKKVKNNH